jgi:hypothetical protein
MPVRQRREVQAVLSRGCLALQSVGSTGTKRDNPGQIPRRCRAKPRECSVDLEAPPGFEPGMEVLQTSALPLGYGADERWEGEGLPGRRARTIATAHARRFAVTVGLPRRSSRSTRKGPPPRPCRYGATSFRAHPGAKAGAGNGIRTRDFDLGKVALYH